MRGSERRKNRVRAAAYLSNFCCGFLAAVVAATVIFPPNTEAKRGKPSRACLTKAFELLRQKRTDKSKNEHGQFETVHAFAKISSAPFSTETTRLQSVYYRKRENKTLTWLKL